MAITPVVSSVQPRQGLQGVHLAQRLSVWRTEDGLMGQPRLHVPFVMLTMTSCSASFDYAFVYMKSTFRCFPEMCGPFGLPPPRNSTDIALYVWGTHVLFKFYRGLLLSLAPFERRSRRSHSSHSDEVTQAFSQASEVWIETFSGMLGVISRARQNTSFRLPVTSPRASSAIPYTSTNRDVDGMRPARGFRCLELSKAGTA